MKKTAQYDPYLNVWTVCIDGEPVSEVALWSKELYGCEIIENRNNRYFQHIGLGVAYDGKYEEKHNFSFGLAAVRKNNKWGFVDDTGREVIHCVYDEVKDCSGNGWLEGKKNGVWKMIDDSKLNERIHKNKKI